VLPALPCVALDACPALPLPCRCLPAAAAALDGLRDGRARGAGVTLAGAGVTRGAQRRQAQHEVGASAWNSGIDCLTTEAVLRPLQRYRCPAL